jgi:hypothetical protein
MAKVSGGIGWFAELAHGFGEPFLQGADEMGFYVVEGHAVAMVFLGIGDGGGSLEEIHAGINLYKYLRSAGEGITHPEITAEQAELTGADLRFCASGCLGNFGFGVKRESGNTAAIFWIAPFL